MSEFAAPSPALVAPTEKPKTLTVDDFAIGDKIGRLSPAHIL